MKRLTIRIRAQIATQGRGPIRRKEQRVSSFCKSCNASIIWAKTPKGSKMCFEAAPTPKGEWQFVGYERVRHVPKGDRVGLELFEPHWGNCPHAESHRGE